jgi:hypothetical protein
LEPQKNNIMTTKAILIHPINPLRSALLAWEAQSAQRIDKRSPVTDKHRQTASTIPLIDTKCQIHKFIAQRKRTGTQRPPKIHR